MKNLSLVKGNCLCAAVQFEFHVEEKIFGVCHCGTCRKWSGGPGFGVATKTDPIFIGPENIQYFSSSDWAERAFCKKCGTHLFYQLKDKSFINFQLGTLENNDLYTFDLQVYIDCKPDNYSFAEKTKNMTEAEVVAAFNK